MYRFLSWKKEACEWMLNVFDFAACQAAGEPASGDVRAQEEGGDGAGGAWASDVGSGGGTEAAAGALGGG